MSGWRPKKAKEEPKCEQVFWGNVEFAYVSTIWFIDVGPRRSNYVMVTGRTPAGEVVGVGRLRMDAGGGAFDFEDEKIWNAHKPAPGMSEARFDETIHLAMRAMHAAIGTGEIHRVEVKGGPQKFLDVYKRQPWAQWRESNPQ